VIFWLFFLVISRFFGWKYNREEYLKLRQMKPS